MPNHIHSIVSIQNQNAAQQIAEVVGATGRSPLREQTPEFKPGPAKRSLGAFVAGFKSSATLRINELRGSAGADVWQRNYHERIIRDETELNNKHQYIENNPLNCDSNEENQ